MVTGGSGHSRGVGVVQQREELTAILLVCARAWGNNHGEGSAMVATRIHARG